MKRRLSLSGITIIAGGTALAGLTWKVLRKPLYLAGTALGIYATVKLLSDQNEVLDSITHKYYNPVIAASEQDVNLKDGTFWGGRMSAYKVVIPFAEGKQYTFTTNNGVRGMNVPIFVKVKKGKAFVYEHIDNGALPPLPKIELAIADISKYTNNG